MKSLLLVIEPNLRNPSGHYAEFVRAVGALAGGESIEVFAHPGAGVTMEERTAVALSAAIDRVLADWPAYAARACEAAPILAAEHDPRHLLELIAGEAIRS